MTHTPSDADALRQAAVALAYIKDMRPLAVRLAYITDAMVESRDTIAKATGAKP